MKQLYSIYKITNTENGKIYIGQTNNWKKRYQHYKTSSFNPNSSDYKRPIHSAIRKYGLSKFNFEIIEEINHGEQQSFIDEREMFFINFFNSVINGNGYNIRLGGQGRVPLTYEESISRSKLFTKEEITDIHNMLLQDAEYDDIICKYYRLTRSFLSNINIGLNFKNPDLNYPLKKSKSSRSQFSKQEQKEIKTELKNGFTYSAIAKKWGIKSISFLTGVNNGKYWHDKNETYPLIQKMSNNSPGAAEKAELAKKLLIFSNNTHETISVKTGYTKSAVSAINMGRNRKDNSLLYPLRENQKENKLRFKSNIVSTISG